MSQEVIDKTRESLIRAQNVDPESIRRTEDLGALNFDEAVPHARRVVDALNRIPENSLDLFPVQQIDAIKNVSDSFYSTVVSIIEFDPVKSGNASGERSELISQMKARSESVLSNLWHHIAFAISSSIDPTSVNQKMRASMQSFEDEKANILKDINSLKIESEAILERVRAAAAEQGVSQQAQHFKQQAITHGDEADEWMRYSLISAGFTLLFAILSVFIHKINIISPQNVYEAVQITTSKVLIFATLSYATFVCVRNFLSHKHNKVVNAHRQNSLLTYTAFVDAAPSAASREIVLAHAAASVFSPQETGYVKQDDGGTGRSVMEMVTKASVQEART